MKTVLVTGASTGIGKACVLALSKIGFRVYAGVRRASDGESLRKEASGFLTALPLDVTSLEEIHAAFELIETAEPAGLFALVNNAAHLKIGPLETSALEDFRSSLAVNYLGPVALIQKFLPLLRKTEGRIVNVSSTSAHIAPPFASAYAASKFALEGMSDALRVELRDSGVQVSLIIPGAVKTPIWRKALEQVERSSTFSKSYEGAGAGARQITERAAQFGMDPALVVKAIHAAISDRRAKARYVVGSSARVQIALKRWLPTRLVDALAHRFISRNV
ncbi:MAG TPA: SDR family oxidoreductase [Lacunisphaera sp.]|nr:SDR family oxidoreductase [Lacunisphaera sp.]